MLQDGVKALLFYSTRLIKILKKSNFSLVKSASSHQMLSVFNGLYRLAQLCTGYPRFKTRNLFVVTNCGAMNYSCSPVAAVKVRNCLFLIYSLEVFSMHFITAIICVATCGQNRVCVVV